MVRPSDHKCSLTIHMTYTDDFYINVVHVCHTTFIYLHVLVDALEHFFWNTQGGVVIELGALDGTLASISQSLAFEQFNWRRILIDGNPSYREVLSQQLQSFAVNAAICKDRRTVHYAVHPNQNKVMSSGILEFMPEHHLKTYFKQMYKTRQRNNNTFDGLEWPVNPQVHAVHCLPVGDILTKAKVTRVNFFILDVEGAELSILDSFDFDKYQVDVFVIEGGVGFPSLRRFFKDKPYEEVVIRGRNIWLKHVDFVPSERKGVHKLCYRGSVRSGIPPRGHRAHCSKNSVDYFS
jgi:hypothetical protein